VAVRSPAVIEGRTDLYITPGGRHALAVTFLAPSARYSVYDLVTGRSSLILETYESSSAPYNWSPDGRYTVITVGGSRPSTVALLIIDLVRQNFIELVIEDLGYSSWAGSEQLLYEDAGVLFAVDPRNGTVRSTSITLRASVSMIAPSADGASLAIGYWDEANSQSLIDIYDFYSGQLLTTVAGWNGRWSFDGEWFAFIDTTLPDTPYLTTLNLRTDERYPIEAVLRSEFELNNIIWLTGNRLHLGFSSMVGDGYQYVKVDPRGARRFESALSFVPNSISPDSSTILHVDQAENGYLVRLEPTSNPVLIWQTALVSYWLDDSRIIFSELFRGEVRLADSGGETNTVFILPESEIGIGAMVYWR
jgi:hypothetical protein